MTSSDSSRQTTIVCRTNFVLLKFVYKTPFYGHSVKMLFYSFPFLVTFSSSVLLPVVSSGSFQFVCFAFYFSSGSRPVLSAERRIPQSNESYQLTSAFPLHVCPTVGSATFKLKACTRSLPSSCPLNSQ